MELSSAAVLLAGTMALTSAAGAALGSFALTLTVDSTRWAAAGPLDLPGAVALLRSLGWRTLLAAAPFMGLLVGGVLLVNVIQARGVVSLTPITLKWSRVSPLEGTGRLFTTQSLVTLIKAIVKLTILGWIAYAVIRRAMPQVVTLSDQDPGTVLAIMNHSARRLALLTGLAFLVLAAADYGYQVWQFENTLKMTRVEVTQDNRETEGDPLIKSRIRAVARALSRRQMLGRVKTADVVITNPTHLAVALKYDPNEASAPVVVAMGARKLAERIKALAAAAGVPRVEDRPLAQALFRTASVGRPIPPALFVAVAEVLAFVYRRRPRGATRPGSAS